MFGSTNRFDVILGQEERKRSGSRCHAGHRSFDNALLDQTSGSPVSPNWPIILAVGDGQNPCWSVASCATCVYYRGAGQVDLGMNATPVTTVSNGSTLLGSPHIFSQSVEAFLKEELKDWGASLRAHHLALQGEQPAPAQIRAWANCFKVLQEVLAAFCVSNPTALSWTAVFEYELPRERGRRPDVLLLTNDRILVLEFKDHAQPTAIEEAAHVDQVAAYARDLAHYQAASHGRRVVPILVYTKWANPIEHRGEVLVTGPNYLGNILLTEAGEGGTPLDHATWLAADYAPLPSLVAAARRLFNREPLPAIHRAQSAGIPETVAELLQIAREAHEKGEHHLAFVTGIPGAGKTLVGLQFVYSNAIEEGEAAREAVFLSGNGPLVGVLQHVLQSKVFVQGVHDFLKQYGGTKHGTPTEHVWVYDEAQRAWDAEQVKDKRNHATSEPEDFLQLGSKMDGWAMLVGLIGEGQEIHIGEEAGLAQWNEALGKVDVPWVVHAPDKIETVFTNAARIETSKRLDLTVSLRSHLAEDLQTWVRQLLLGDIETARSLLPAITAQGFDIYLTRDLKAAKAYARTRYEGADDKRYGLITSSKANNLREIGLDTWNNGVRHHNAGKWFNNEPSHADSCCQCTTLATEFVCQGLELDLPVVCWGNDFTWNGTAWQTRPTRARAGHRTPERPEELRLNSYRVLLSRGRDAMILYVPEQPALDETFQLLASLGLTGL